MAMVIGLPVTKPYIQLVYNFMSYFLFFLIVLKTYQCSLGYASV